MNSRIRSALVAATLVVPASAALADDADSAPGRRGNSLVQIGLFHVDTLDSSQPLHTQLNPGPVLGLTLDSEFDSPGTSATVSTSDTLALIYSYFFTDHIALKLEGGIPAVFKLYGNGTVQPYSVGGLPLGAIASVDLGAAQNNPLAKVTQWSPVTMINYYFRDSTAQIRPYVGLGATYTWFNNIKVDKDFQNSLNTQFGTLLATGNGKTGATSVKAKASSDIEPVFNMGVSAELSPRWSLSGSVSFIPLKTKAKITIDASDGTNLATSTTKLDLNPLVIALLVGYRFDLPKPF